MLITNKQGLPSAIVAAVANDPYDRGDCFASATELVGPATLGALRRAHGEELEEDAADRIWSLLGQSVHHIISRAEQAHELSEQRITADVGGFKISGQFDLFDGETLSDFKVTSVWSIKAGCKPEWTAQLNVLAYLLHDADFTVAKLQIIAVLRDWSRADYMRNPGSYPVAASVTIPVELWPLEKTREYILERCLEHDKARRLYAIGEELPPCSSEERWEKSAVFAVMKEGRKSAVKLHETREAAEAHAKELGAKHSVVERPGESTRCMNYCSVCSFCPFGQQVKAA